MIGEMRHSEDKSNPTSINVSESGYTFRSVNGKSPNLQVKIFSTSWDLDILGVVTFSEAQSPYTHAALIELAQAMRKDNHG